MEEFSWPLAMRVERGKIRELARALHAASDDNLDVAGDDRVGLFASPTFPSAVLNHWGRPVADILIELGCDLNRVLHGSEEYEYPSGPLREGQELRGEIRLVGEEQKTGSDGTPMRLLHLEGALEDQRGGPCVRFRRTIIEKG